MKITLRNDQQSLSQMRQLWLKIKQALEGGNTLVLQITKESRSQSQSAMYHSIIGQIAKQAQHLGSSWSAEDFKRLLVWQWATDTGRTASKIVPSLDGSGFVQLGLQTREFTKADASEFTEFCMAWAAQNGVTIND